MNIQFQILRTDGRTMSDIITEVNKIGMQASCSPKGIIHITAPDSTTNGHLVALGAILSKHTEIMPIQ